MVSKKISKLEILSEMTRRTRDFTKDVLRGYTREQLVSTFNVPGCRSAQKYLPINPQNFKLGERIGWVTGVTQDTLGSFSGLIYISSLSPFNPEFTAPSCFAIPTFMIATKLATNTISYPCSVLSDLYKTAKKYLEKKSSPIREGEKITDKEVQMLFGGENIGKLR